MGAFGMGTILSGKVRGLNRIIVSVIVTVIVYDEIITDFNRFVNEFSAGKGFRSGNLADLWPVHGRIWIPQLKSKPIHWQDNSGRWRILKRQSKYDLRLNTPVGVHCNIFSGRRFQLSPT